MHGEGRLSTKRDQLVPLGLCRWLLACDYKAVAARDRREIETKGRGANVMFSQTVMGIEMKLSGAGMSETLKSGSLL